MFLQLSVIFSVVLLSRKPAEAEVVTPMYSAGGDPEVVGLMDIHRFTENEMCMEFSPRTAEMTFALEWFHQDMVKKGISPIPGLVIYDTCGDVRRTLVILGSLLSSQSTNISSVISYGQPALQSRISQFLQPFGILHININQTAYVSTQGDRSIDISTVSPWRVRDILTIVMELKWNNFALISSQHPSAIASRDLFLKMAAPYSLCISSVFIHDKDKEYDDLPSHVILFVSADDSYDEIISSTSFANSFVLLTSDHWEDLASNFTDKFLYLEHLNTSTNLVKFVKDKIEDLSDNSTFIESYRNKFNCIQDASGGTCNGQTTATFLPSRFMGRDIEAAISALTNAQNLLKHFDSNNCSSLDLFHCLGRNTFRAVHDGFSEDITPFTGMYQLMKDVGGEMTSYINRGYITVAEVYGNEISIRNTLTWSRVKSLPHDACPKNQCGNCTTPSPPLTNPETRLVEGDMIVRLQLPLTQKSLLGKSCDDWKTEGVILTEVFKYEVSKFAGQFPNMLKHIKLGGVAFDSCQGDPTRNENITADIELIDDDEILTPKPFSSGQRFTVSSLGVSFGDPDSSQFVHAAVELLKSLKWTYVHVVFSPGETLITDFETYLKKTGHDICVPNKIAVENNATDIAIKLQKSLTKSSGGAFLLLTNAKDTLFLKTLFSTINNAFSGVNLITFPWNRNIITHPGTIFISSSTSSVDDVVSIVQNLKPDSNLTDIILKSFHEHRYKCSINMHQEMIYPDICSSYPTLANDTLPKPLISVLRKAVEVVTSLLDRYYRASCPNQAGKCNNMTNRVDLSKFLTATGDNSNSYRELMTKKDVYIYQGNSISRTAVKVGSISEDGVVSVSANDVITYNPDFVSYTAVHQCHDWCPECHGCSSPSVATIENLYQSGDIIIAGLFPVHKSQSSFCDALNTDARADIMVDAFLFALASAKERYPYLLPGVNLGSLVLDTCSDGNMAAQTLMNFETCKANYKDRDLVAGPQLVTMYMSTDSMSISNQIQDTLQKYNKSSFAINHETSSVNNDITSRFYSTYSKAGIRTIFEILNKTQWSYINIARSNSSVFDSVVDEFLWQSRNYNICVHGVSSIAQYKVERLSTLSMTVIFANIKEIEIFFKSLIASPTDHSFIIGEIGPSWSDVSDIVIPNNVRILAIERTGKINTDLVKAFSEGPSTIFSRNPWKTEFEKALSSCISPSCASGVDLQLASNIVFGVDVMLHAFHNRFEKSCSNYYGVCQQLANEKVQLQKEHFNNISFTYLNNIHINFPPRNVETWAFVVKNFNGGTLVNVGNYSDGILHFDPYNIYDTNGRKFHMQESRCYSNCRCIGLEDETNSTFESAEDPFANMELKFFKSSSMLNKDLWTIIVLIISIGGAFVAFCFVIFVLQKVFAGLLAKRYVGLGILLLVSIIFLFLSVLPFVFTPSNVVCSTRFFIPGFAYSLSFATLLVKIMSLRSYKLIGLGGELSNINQFLTVLFITGVQISMGIHFWYIEDQQLGFMRTRLNDVNQLEYACVFDRIEFVQYLVFVMFLILLCAIYSIFVRNETKNMGEAKFIMVYSWLCIPIWVAWVVCLIVLPRFWAEVIVCVGILTCATLMTLIVFLPKLHRISRLKYDVKRSGMENGGYKVDTDFMFERPYTLPTSSRSSNKYSVKSNPRFISSFDTSLSY